MQFLTWLHRNLSMVRTWAGNTGLFKTETGTGTAKENFLPQFYTGKQDRPKLLPDFTQVLRQVPQKQETGPVTGFYTAQFAEPRPEVDEIFEYV